MYITSEATFSAPGVGAQGNGIITAQLGALQNITVTATCTSAITGSPTINVDLQYGDNVIGGNSDTAFASGAVSAVIASPPVAAGNSAGGVVLSGGCARSSDQYRRHTDSGSAQGPDCG